MKSYEDFDAAKADAGPDDMVNGTLVKGEARYFVLPRATTDEQIHDAAFEVRNGRTPSDYERWLMTQAKALRAKAAA